MGLISIAADMILAGGQALTGSLESGMWKEYYQSGDMSDGIIMKRGEQVLSEKGRNTKRDENLISNGSAIDVQEGQCMIIVDNGRIADFTAIAGRYVYDESSAPSVLTGENKSLKPFAEEIRRQWSAGGQRYSSQRVYFINMNELINTPIKWGCGNIAFHNVTQVGNSPIELDMTLKGNGLVTVKVTDPLTFFTEIGSQKTGTDYESTIKVTDSGIMENLKSGIIDKISIAISQLGTQERISYTAIGSKSALITAYMNDLLSNEWLGKRGFEISSFTVNGSFVPTDDDLESLKELQKVFNMSGNLNAANYDIQKTMAKGVENAGKNGGASGLFGLGMGMNMMGGTGLGQMTNQQPVQPMQNAAPTPAATPAPAAPQNVWMCSCGTENTGKFCKNCGTQQGGTLEGGWTCTCGAKNSMDSKFCTECGTKKPVIKKYVCDKCGWTPAEGEQVKFCPNCGDPFDSADEIEV